MRKIAILKCHESENDYGAQVHILDQDCYELEDDEAKFVIANLHRLSDWRAGHFYKAVEYCQPVIHEDATDIISRLRQLKADDEAMMAARDKARAKAREKELATRLERKRKQLAKLKKELGDG